MSFYGQQRFVRSSAFTGSSTHLLAPVELQTSYAPKGVGASLVQAAAAMSPARLRAAVQALQISPATRTAMRQALEVEAAAAAAMPDDVFWGYDRVWVAMGAPTLEDVRKDGACGGGGCNMSWNNNQFWSLTQQCDRASFSLVMFQQRRYMAAQVRLQRLLDLAPDQRVLEGFDRFATQRGSVRDACQGAAVRDKPTEWAAWCVDVLKTIGVARWASNVTWSEGSVAIPDLPADALALGRVTSKTGDQPGCIYAPDCVSDAFGVPRYGYVSGKTPNGVLRYEAVCGRRMYGWRPVETADTFRPRRDDEARTAASSWRPGDVLPRLVGEPLWSIAPKALGLHKSSRSFDWVTSSIPMGMDDFEPVILPEAAFPSILRAPQSRSAFDWLSALFAELDAPAEQFALRERTGAWWFMGREYAYPSAAGELVVWHVLALLRDVLYTSFGAVLVQAFENLERAVNMLPPWARNQSLTDAVAAMRSVLRAEQEQAAATMGAVFGGVSSVVGAIVPVAGIVIALIGAIVTGLMAAALELGLLREGNPPALQFLVARQIPVSGTEDRCWINPGSETYAAYNERVASVFAEAARRTGGDAARTFDEVERVRAERVGGAMLLPTVTETSSGLLVPAVIVGTALAGAAAIALVARKKRKGRR